MLRMDGRMVGGRSMEASERPHREVTTKRVTSFTTSDRSDSPATDNHMDGKMPHGLFRHSFNSLQHRPEHVTCSCLCTAG